VIAGGVVQYAGYGIEYSSICRCLVLAMEVNSKDKQNKATSRKMIKVHMMPGADVAYDQVQM
jgi:hypothetical protein